MIRSFLTIICILTVAALASSAQAQDASLTRTAAYFRDAAVTDIEAAWSLLDRNHPGAASEMHDTHFRDMLDTARNTARVRAAQVTTLEAYLAVMSGFSNMLGDKHLSFKPALTIAKPNWIGVLIARRGDHWVVVDEDPWPGRAPLRDTVLTGCDGRAVEDVARERLGGFRADWSIEAQRGLAAPWLLIDERNPFVRPLQRCTFVTSNGPREIMMDWQPITRDVIIDRINKAAGAGAAGFGVRRAGRGWWIAIGEFTANAPAVVAAALKHQAELRASPFVVFDLRGNAGGSSDIGDQIARILYGDRSVPTDDSATDCKTPWRVSLDNKARLESYPKLLGDRLSSDASAKIQSDIRAMQAAASRGRAFSRPIGSCKSPRHIARVKTGPRLYMITDRVCFSSCLIVVKTFRELGAVQVGEATNANTRYQENRTEPLPSGLGTFSVQATVDLTQPSRVGPFKPDVAYDGDLTDTPAVTAWLLAKVIAENHG